MKTIVAVLALAMALVANVASATATWEHFNADPAYQSREAAITDASRVMRQAGYPEPVISLLTEAMKKPGTEAHVTNGMKLDFMRSGKTALWRNVLVKFKKPPREASMEYSAPAEEWTVDWNGTKWTMGIPKVCNNSYGKRVVVSSPPPVAKLVPPPASCTDTGWIFEMRNYSEQTLPEVLRKQAAELIAAANAADSSASRTPKNLDGTHSRNAEMYKGDKVSRLMGEPLYKQVKPTGDFGISILLLDPSTFDVSENLGIVPVGGGVGRIILTDAQHLKIVKTVWPGNSKSPTLSGDEKQNWFFPAEWQSEKGNRCIPRIVSGISAP